MIKGWGPWLAMFAVSCGHAARTHAPEAEASHVDVTLVPQFAHAGAVGAAAMSADARVAVTAGADAVVKVWDVASGALLRTLHGDASDPVSTSLVLTPDGKHAITASNEIQGGPVRGWDVETGRMEWSVAVDVGVWGLAIAPDGGRVLVAAGTGLQAIDVASGQATVVGPNAQTATFVDADRALISDGNVVSLLDLATGTIVRSYGLNAFTLQASDDGTVAASLFYDTVELWSPETGEPELVFDVPDGVEKDGLALSHDGSYFVVRIATDHSIRVYARDGTWMRTLRSNSAEAANGQALSLSKDGRVLFSAGAHSIELWDIDRSEPRRTFGVPAAPISSVAFSPGGDRLFAVAGDRFTMWNAHTLALTGSSTSLVDEPYGVAVSVLTDDAAIVAGEYPHRWDGASRLPAALDGLGTAPEGTDGPYRHLVAISRDGALGAIVVSDGASAVLTVEVWDLVRPRLRRSLAGHVSGYARRGSFSADGTKLALNDADAMVGLWDVTSGEQLAAISTADPQSQIHIGGDVRDLSPDGNLALVERDDLTKPGLEIVDFAAGSVTRRLEDPSITWTFGMYSSSSAFGTAAWSPDARRIATGGDDWGIHLWDAASGELTQTLRGHTGAIQSLAFSPDGSLLASGSDDGSIRLWRLDTGASVVLLSAGDDWLAYDDDGYFDASLRGGNLAAAVTGMRAYRLDQLAVRNNRPDLLLVKLGIADADLTAHFAAQHERRLAELGLDERALASAFDRVPTATITAIDDDGASAEMTFTLASTGADLLAYNTYVNGVPLHAAPGVATDGRTQTITERIELTAGDNRVEVGVIDRAGAESLRPFRVLHGTDTDNGDLYFVGFGVSHYQHREYDLGYPDKDALDLAAVFGQAQGYDRVHAVTYVDEQATVASFTKAKKLLAKARPMDTVIVFVAGHGVHAQDAEAAYYYVAYDTDAEDLAATGASFGLIEALVRDTAARRKLLLLDTCASGDEADDAGEVDDVPGSRSRAIRGIKRRARGAVVAPKPWLYQRERYIYEDLTRRSGAVVLSSSRGAEPSYEYDAIQNGAFTQALLGAITSADADPDQDGWLSVAELENAVTETVTSETAGLQHPTLDRSNPDAPVVIPLVAGARDIATRKSKSD